MSASMPCLPFLTKDMTATSHSGLRTLFHQHLIQPGLLPLGQGQLYDRLFDQRQRSDYADLVHFGVHEVRVWYVEAQAFVAAIAVLIQQALRRPSLDRTVRALAPPRREAIALHLLSYQRPFQLAPSRSP